MIWARDYGVRVGRDGMRLSEIPDDIFEVLHGCDGDGNPDDMAWTVAVALYVGSGAAFRRGQWEAFDSEAGTRACDTFLRAFVPMESLRRLGLIEWQFDGSIWDVGDDAPILVRPIGDFAAVLGNRRDGQP